jgi:hypothetical protein
MIEITTGTNEEKIIRILQKKYPIVVKDIENELHLSRDIIMRILQKFQVKGYVQLESLPNKIFIRLLRQDFSFVGKKRQKKFIKHKSGGKKPDYKDYDGMMYS